MSDLHPFFVHFPIALLIVAALFDLYGAARKHQSSTISAFILQAIAAISALFAAISGNGAESNILAQSDLVQELEQAMEAHISFANILVWVIIAVVLGRTITMLEQKMWAPKVWVFSFLTLALAISVTVAGLLGGQLSHGILQYYIQH